MRIVDAILAFPALVLAIALAAAFGPSLQNAMLAVAITLAPQFARVARSQALSVSVKPYVEAAVSLGLPNSRILFRYIFVNGLGPLLVQSTLALGSAILQTASLGFLGLGAQPPMAEWGADVSANLQYVRSAPWVALAPGMAILFAVLSFNLVGDSLADWFNPRRRSELD
ncbi:ABC transporter permease [Rhizobium sp. BG6]|nr:ABC transporter permease [Rhizobium sp. BG6]